MRGWAASRPRRGAAVALCGLALLIGTFVGVALAHQHWHETAGQWHGFVHGSYTTDGVFFARVAEGTLNGTRGCQIDAVWNPPGFRTEYEVDWKQLCNVYSGEIWDPWNVTECAYRADNYSSTFFNWHHNYPVNYCS